MRLPWKQDDAALVAHPPVRKRPDGYVRISLEHLPAAPARPWLDVLDFGRGNNGGLRHGAPLLELRRGGRAHGRRAFHPTGSRIASTK